MRAFLKNTAIILTLTGAALATTASAGAGGLVIGYGSDQGYRRGAAVSVSFNDVAFGYRDGYWDNGHRWHHWNNDRDYRDYRSRYAGNYRDWNHNRDGGDGWQRGRTPGFSDIAFAYRDGYWDNGHRWHRWNNDRDYRDYRRHYAGSYRDWDHDRDGGDGWQHDSDRGRDYGRHH